MELPKGQLGVVRQGDGKKVSWPARPSNSGRGRSLCSQLPGPPACSKEDHPPELQQELHPRLGRGVQPPPA